MNTVIFRCNLIVAILLTMVALTGAFTNAAMVQTDLPDVAEADFHKADAQLNILYKETLKVITQSDTRDNFIRAQRAWIAFRDAEAEFRASIGNKGTVEETELTKEHIQQLRRLKASIP